MHRKAGKAYGERHECFPRLKLRELLAMNLLGSLTNGEQEWQTCQWPARTGCGTLFGCMSCLSSLRC